MSHNITINGRKIGPGHPVYIIAEMSANHGQNFDKAIEIIQAMKNSGADAVKLQTYTADTMTIDSDREEFKIGKGTAWEGKKLYDLYKEAHTPWEWQPKLKEEAEKLGMDFFSTPFDDTSVDFLEGMNMPAYKIASYELTDLPLIEKIASKGKPIIISTAMGAEEEIGEAIATAKLAGASEIAILKCTNAYPAPPEEFNLKTIPDMSEKFRVPVGLSDHSLGIAVPITAIAMGACIIEKHFTLSREDEGPDSTFSLEPTEFKQMVEAVRTAEKALGEISYQITKKEQSNRIFRRSIFAVKNISEGDELTKDNVRIIRPDHGLPPKKLKEILGKKAKNKILRGTPISVQLIQS